MRLLITLLATLLLAGCGLFGAGNPPQGKNLAVPYSGLADKSLAIVVFVPPATLNEFPGTPEEISNFIRKEIALHLPSTRLLNPLIVIDWQSSTLNWFALPEEEIGRHFSVDRVLYIQVLTYATGGITNYTELRGHLRAQCKIFDSESPVSPPPPSPATAAASAPAPLPVLPAPAWSGIIDAYWPPTHPLDPTQTDEAAVRYQTLETFAEQLVRYFY